VHEYYATKSHLSSLYFRTINDNNTVATRTTEMGAILAPLPVLWSNKCPKYM